MAYLTTVKANGKRYVYLTEYVGEQAHTEKKEKRIYSFGPLDDVLYKMYFWKLNYPEFPQDLRNLGFGYEDIKKWIRELEKMKNRKKIRFKDLA